MEKEKRWKNITDRAEKTAKQIARAAEETSTHIKHHTGQIVEKTGAVVSTVSTEISRSTTQPNTQLNRLSEDERLVVLAALIAFAAADGPLGPPELKFLFGNLDMKQLSPGAYQKLAGYLLFPPPVDDALDALVHMVQHNETLHYATMMTLLDIARVDGKYSPEEERTLARVQQQLGIGDEQQNAMQQFVEDIIRLQEGQNIDDSRAIHILKNAVATLGSAGVPIVVVHGSGSVAGLSAAGITSGLAALGAGGLFGMSAMMTGLGVVALLGATTYAGISYALDIGGSRRQTHYRKRKAERAKLATEQLEEMMHYLRALQADPATPPETHPLLNDRLRLLTDISLLQEQKPGSV